MLTVDKPRKRYQRDLVQEEKDLKSYVRKMARKFGWKIISAKKSKIKPTAHVA